MKPGLVSFVLPYWQTDKQTIGVTYLHLSFWFCEWPKDKWSWKCCTTEHNLYLSPKMPFETLYLCIHQLSNHGIINNCQTLILYNALVGLLCQNKILCKNCCSSFEWLAHSCQDLQKCNLSYSVYELSKSNAVNSVGPKNVARLHFLLFDVPVLHSDWKS